MWVYGKVPTFWHACLTQTTVSANFTLRDLSMLKCKKSDMTEWLNWPELKDVFLEKPMAPHSSTLAWQIPWMEEPGRLQSMGSRRVGHDWAISLSLFTFMHWRRNGNPLQGSCLENPRDGGAWWAAVYGVSQSWTRLKWLSSSSSKDVFQFFSLKSQMKCCMSKTCFHSLDINFYFL